MSDESRDPFEENPDLEWANTVAMDAVPRPEELQGATVPTQKKDLENALQDDVQDATVAAQADDLQRAIQQDLQRANQNQGPSDPGADGLASTAPDHRFDTGMRAAQGVAGAGVLGNGAPGGGAPGGGSAGDGGSPASHGPSPQPPRGPGSAQPPSPQQSMGPGPQQQGMGPGPQQQGMGPRPGMMPGNVNQSDGPSWKQVASGLGIYRVAFVFLIFLMPAIIGGFVYAAKEESLSMAKATFYGGPALYFLIGIGVVLSQFKMSRVPSRVGGSGILTTAFVCSTIALASMAISYLWFMSLIDLERFGRMSFEQFGFTIIMIAILAGGAYLMWTIGFLLMVVGWRQIGESLNASKARSLAGTTLVLFGILFLMNSAQPFLVDAGGEPVLMAMGLASLILTIVFLIWVVRAASSLRSAILSRFPNA